MSPTNLVLDSAAIAAFARGSLRVGEYIAKAADQGGEIVAPVLCLAEAYRIAVGLEHDYLAALAAHPHVTVAPVEEADYWVIGGWSRKIGSLHLAQAAAETAARPTIALLTADRERVTEHLPKEWPIIDL